MPNLKDEIQPGLNAIEQAKQAALQAISRNKEEISLAGSTNLFAGKVSGLLEKALNFQLQQPMKDKILNGIKDLVPPEVVAQKVKENDELRKVVNAFDMLNLLVDDYFKIINESNAKTPANQT